MELNEFRQLRFHKILESEIEEFSQDGTELRIRPSPNSTSMWVPILQPYDDIINYERKKELFDFYLIGNDEEGYIQIPTRKRRLFNNG